MKFISKKNAVTLRDGLVYKQVKDPHAAGLEAAVLRELRGAGVPVPEVISCEGNRLVLEYLPGEPLPDIIEHGGYDPDALAGALLDWFAAFYAAVQPDALRGDVNGRNFLFDGAKVYSVDFEERCTGPRARDAGRLAAFIETYETRARAKQIALARALMQGFSERFGCGMEEILAEREGEFAAMRKRRLPHGNGL